MEYDPSFPELPKEPVELICSSNELLKLPILSVYLVKLDCHENCLEQLPELPPRLQILYCGWNKLTYLPKLPESLIELKCCNNLFINLPKLPLGLRILHCSWNKLTYLPELPQSLTELRCINNFLVTLPELPLNPINLFCSGNNFLRHFDNGSWEFPSLLEITLRFLAEEASTKIIELDEKIKNRDICGWCGKKSLMREIIVNRTIGIGTFPVKYKRCWLCPLLLSID